MAAPAPNSTAAQQPGPINDEDVNHWKARINDVLARPSEHVNHKSPESSRPWSNAFFGCFSPIDLCLVSWCVPCVTFGKTHHRLHKSARLEGYEPVNTSCLLLWGSGCFGLHWVPMSIQRREIRERFGLQGNCITDIATACCCGVCDLVQQEKEVALLGEKSEAVTEQYKTQGGMAYGQ